MIKLLFILSSIFLSTSLLAETKKILVVTNDNNIDQLSKQQIKQIYMKGISYDLKPISLNQGNKTRIIFNSRIIGLTESRINSYWIQMKFSGKSESPIEFENIEDIIKHLKKESKYIAYFPQDIEIPSTLKIIYTLEY